MSSQGRPEDLESKIANLLMTGVAGHQVAARLKECEAGWHDRAAMTDLRARRAEMQRDEASASEDNIYVLNAANRRYAAG